MKSRTLLFAAATLLVATAATSADKPKPATEGTTTSYESDRKTVIHVEACDKTEDGWDYVSCMRVMREATITKLCKRGAGTYTWAFIVGAEKSSMLVQTTGCK